MTIHHTHFPGMWRVRGAAAVLAVCALALAGCEKPPVAELANTADQNQEEVSVPGETTQAAARRSQRRRRGPAITPAVGQGQGGQVDLAASYVPRPAPSPTPVPESVAIMATDMATAQGAKDKDGGMLLTSNGALQLDGVKLDFPVSEVELEVRGEPAHEIWPEFDINAYNRTKKVNSYPWPRDYATSTTYHTVRRPIDPPLAPGEYLLTVRYYNNSALPEGSTEDRNFGIRKIVFHP